MRRCTFAVVTVLFVLGPWLVGARADQSAYTIQDLGRIDGLVPTVTGLNASGQVSGYISLPVQTSDEQPVTRAVRYSHDTGWAYLPGLDLGSTANGINAHGDLTGSYVSPSGATLAYRYTDAGGVQPIGPLPDGNFTVGRAINAAGEVVGYGDASGVVVAFRALPLQGAQTLPSLGGAFAVACGINDAGQIVGSSFTPEGVQHLTLINADGAVFDAGTFDGPAGNSSGCAVDGKGRVGGQSTRSGAFHALRVFNGTMLDVDAFGSSFSIVEAITDGTSVGWFLPAGNETARAFIHTDAKGSVDLNALIAADSGWALAKANAVNANGQIAGEGTLNGAPAAFLLLPPTADTTAPVFTSLTASPATIWPPKGQTVTVTLTAVATDDSGAAPACTLASIAGPGSAPDDFNVTGPNTGTVRAVGGSSYTFNEQCADAAGNVARSSVTVTVPRDTTAPVVERLGATPSTIWPPNGALVPVTLTVLATDDVDDAPVCGLTSIASTGTTADDYAITGQLSARVRAIGGRTYTMNVRCSDAAGNFSNASAAVFVPRDTTAPSINWISASPSSIWPPNGKLVPAVVSVSATDDVDARPTCALTSITGAPAEDFQITGPLSANVRAEKNSDGSTRIYSLNVSCSDTAGNVSTAQARVMVTKNDGSGDYYHVQPGHQR